MVVGGAGDRRDDDGAAQRRTFRPIGGGLSGVDERIIFARAVGVVATNSSWPRGSGRSRGRSPSNVEKTIHEGGVRCAYRVVGAFIAVGDQTPSKQLGCRRDVSGGDAKSARAI
jgi:hypothetical protein